MGIKSTIWNLKEVIHDLITTHSTIEEIYLFGSRAHKTNSRRSDIDLLIYTNTPIASRDITDWLHSKYPPVDVFITTDKTTATSIINGSVIYSDKSQLSEKLSATFLWDTVNTYHQHEQAIWEQLIDDEIDFKMSNTGVYLEKSPEDIINQYHEILLQRGMPYYNLGNQWRHIGDSISRMIELNMRKTDTPLNKKAKNFNVDCIKLKDEYDFQHLIYFTLKPVFPTIEAENQVIRIDGNKKNADFGILDNRIIIEAKHIKDTSSKNIVVKTLEGLKSFYTNNPNVKLLLFFVLYEGTVKLDERRNEALYSSEMGDVCVIVKFIKNPYT